MQVLDSHIYIDEAKSGQASHNRENFRAMLKAALHKNPPFNRILVEHTSRIARNPREALDVFSLLTFYGVHVSYVSQGIDTSSTTAEEMITINGLIDSLYLRNLALETRRGILGQILKGFSGGGKRYGYYSEPVPDGKVDIYGNPTAAGYVLKINPIEAEVIRRIYKMYGEQGLSARKIVTILNKEIKETGCPKPMRGTYWTISAILGSRQTHTGIINNQIYLGKYIWNKTTVRRNPETGARRTIRKDRNEWITADNPNLAIIPQELWQQVKQRQKEVSDLTSGRYVKGRSLYSTNLLTGIVTCANCGGNIVIVSGGKSRGKYGCSSNWNKGDYVCRQANKYDRDWLEYSICKLLPINISSSGSLQYLHNQVNAILHKKTPITHEQNELRAAQTFLIKIENNIHNYVKAISVGFQSEAVLIALQESEKKRDILLKRMQTLDAEKTTQPKRISKAEIAKYLTDLRSTLKIHPQIGRKLLSTYLGKLVIEGNTINLVSPKEQKTSPILIPTGREV